MSMKRGALIFDLDGTLLDTLEDLWASLDQALTGQGLPGRSREEVRDFVGDGVSLLVQRALPPGAAPEIHRTVLDAFIAHYHEHCADRTRPYPGVTAMLRELRRQGYAAAVVSNKPQRETQALCRRFFPGLLDLAEGHRPELPKKPAPDLPLLVLRRLGFGPEQAVYIGDSQVDIETARAAGLEHLGVSWGYRSRSQLELSGARCIADLPRQVPDLLARLAQDRAQAAAFSAETPSSAQPPSA